MMHDPSTYSIEIDAVELEEDKGTGKFHAGLIPSVSVVVPQLTARLLSTCTRSAYRRNVAQETVPEGGVGKKTAGIGRVRGVVKPETRRFSGSVSVEILAFTICARLVACAQP